MMHCWNVNLRIEPSMGLAWSSEVKFQIRTCCSHAWNCHQLWLCKHHMNGGLRGQSYLDITSTFKYYGRWLFCFPLIPSSKGLAQLWRSRATGLAEYLEALRHSEKQKRTSELSWETVFRVPSIPSCQWAEALTDLCYRSPKAADYTVKLSPREEKNSFSYCWVNKGTASGEESRLAYCLYYQRFGFSKLLVPLSGVPATV